MGTHQDTTLHARERGSLSSALFISAFFDELIRCGVRDVVVSPGSRSTPLAMVAYESDLRVHIDIDERGAAFFALGLAKASGLPVAAICTSGTAVANYYPAVLEAESSRVPLLLLTGDRPPQLQNLGAPQTCDQLNVYGRHVRHFQQMPLPGDSPQEIAFARQMALTACLKAVGNQSSENDEGRAFYGCIGDAGPVHFNFPFDEPLKPCLDTSSLFSCNRRQELMPADKHDAEGGDRLSPLIHATAYPDASVIKVIAQLLKEKKCLVLCGEGCFANTAEAQTILAWARHFKLPLCADPLSQLRSFDVPEVLDSYDSFLSSEEGALLVSEVDMIIRFGRYPVSKSCSLAFSGCMQIVVDAFETRDFNVSTDMFVRCTPAAFAASFLYDTDFEEGMKQEQFLTAWMQANERSAQAISHVVEIEEGFEGAFVYRLLDMVEEGSCLFSASSMAIRMLDTFYKKQNKSLRVLCNRGLNGIDGCTSSALGAAHCFKQTTFITGDLAFLHDLNALNMQGEILGKGRGRHSNGEGTVPAVVIILFNNDGGVIFDMLPQRSTEDYFERLFRTAHHTDFESIAAGFGVPYARAKSIHEFEAAYSKFVSKKGIHLIEVPVEYQGFKERYAAFLT